MAEAEIIVKKIRDGWTSGIVRYRGKDFRFQIKNYPEPSMFGINKGCISKLSISKMMPSGEKRYVASYDRGWLMKPTAEEDKKVYRAILRRFNRGMSDEIYEMWKRSLI